MQKTEIQVGQFGSLVLFAIWLVGLVQIVKWVIQGLL
jgi:hypothetical protein